MKTAAEYAELYKLQDSVLCLAASRKDAYKGVKVLLSGGTALSRGWLHHRDSDDLDFFFKAEDRDFIADCNRFLNALPAGEIGQIRITEKFETLVNLNILNDRIKHPLRIQLMPSHYFYGESETGLLQGFPIDSVRNIFSEKIAAFMDRKSPKDIADIYSILTLHGGFTMSEIIAEAVPKGVNITVPNICRTVLEFNYDRLNEVQWTSPVNIAHIRDFMSRMADILLRKGEFETPLVFAALKAEQLPASGPIR